MKSLKERLEEKRLRQEKEEMKLSSKVKCYTVRLPYSGHPYAETHGDLTFIEQKVHNLLFKIWTRSDSMLYIMLKGAIAVEEKKREQRRIEREKRYAPINLNSQITPVSSPQPATASTVNRMTGEERLSKLRRIEELKTQTNAIEEELTRINAELNLDEQQINRENQALTTLTATTDFTPEVEDATIQPPSNLPSIQQIFGYWWF